MEAYMIHRRGAGQLAGREVDAPGGLWRDGLVGLNGDGLRVRAQRRDADRRAAGEPTGRHMHTRTHTGQDSMTSGSVGHDVDRVLRRGRRTRMVMSCRSHLTGRSGTFMILRHSQVTFISSLVYMLS
jgi:hypothetical protein